MNTILISQTEAYTVMFKKFPDLLNIEEMCEILNVSTKTGYKLLKDSKIDSIKVGRSYRIPKANLFSYLKIGCKQSA